MNSISRALSKTCTSDENVFYSEKRPCINGLTKKGRFNNCCGQTDIKFLEDVATIYSSRSNSRSDKSLENVLSYVEQYHNFDFSTSDYIDVHLNSKKGRYMLELAETYESTVPLTLYQTKATGFKSAKISSNNVIYIVHGLDNIDAPMHKYLSIQGDNSTVNFDTLKIFSSPGSLDFQEVVSTIKGKSFLSIGVPLKFDGVVAGFHYLSTIIYSFLQLGKALVNIGGTETIFHFETMYTMSKEFVKTVADSIDLEFVHNDQGSLYEERIDEELMTIEIRVPPVGGLVCLLKTVRIKPHRSVQLNEVVMKSDDVLKKTATDIITFEEKTVEDYLEEDPKNMVILSDQIAHFTNEDDISVAMSDGIVYACKTANGKLFQDASNVESDVELFNSRRIGTLGGYIIADHVRAATGTQSRIVMLSDSLKTVPTVISKKVYDGQDDLVSANHCQPGAEGGVFGLNVIKLE